MNNYPSDEEVSKSVVSMLDTAQKSIEDAMKRIKENQNFSSKKVYEQVTTPEQIDDIFYKILNGLNEERKKAGFKSLTAKRLATAINSNPWLKNSTEELYNILTKCEKAGNYKFASFILFPKKKK